MVTAMGVVRSSLTLSESDQYMKVSPFNGEREGIDRRLHVIDLRTREISGDRGRYIEERIPDQGCSRYYTAQSGREIHTYRLRYARFGLCCIIIGV